MEVLLWWCTSLYSESFREVSNKEDGSFKLALEVRVTDLLLEPHRQECEQHRG